VFDLLWTGTLCAFAAGVCWWQAANGGGWRYGAFAAYLWALGVAFAASVIWRQP